MRLYKLFNPLGDSPCFCVPVFIEGTQTYTQAINDKGKISGFDICSVPCEKLIAPPKTLDLEIGDLALYSFYFGPSEIVVGTKQEVSDRLRGDIARFDKSPFLQYEIADFVADEHSREAARAECLRLLVPHPVPKPRQIKRRLKMTLLIVEDERSYREFLVSKLEANYEILEAATGEECIEMASRRPDVVLLDVSIPPVKGRPPKRIGLDLIPQIHALDPLLEIIMISGTYMDMETAEEAKQRGAYDYIMKVGDDLERLPTSISKAFDKRRLAIENRIEIST